MCSRSCGKTNRHDAGDNMHLHYVCLKMHAIFREAHWTLRLGALQQAASLLIA